MEITETKQKTTPQPKQSTSWQTCISIPINKTILECADKNQNVSADYLPVVRIEQNEIEDVKTLINLCDNPVFATKKQIYNLFISILNHNISLKNQDLATREVIFKNMADFLSKEIHANALKEIEQKIIKNNIFFPSPCEIIKAQSDYLANLRIVRIIASKSVYIALNGYDDG
jgi:hypothetical protein